MPWRWPFFGCPVVASTGAAIPEVWGTAAISLDRDDPEGWTAALDRMTADPEPRAGLSQAGRQRVQRFTWDRAAKTPIGHLARLASC